MRRAASSCTPLLSCVVLLAACAAPAPSPAPADPTGEWLLASLHGEPVADPVSLTLRDGEASGVGPCNRFRGSAAVRGETIALGPLVATRRACPGLALEDAWLGALTDATRFAVSGPALTLFGPDDAVLMTLRRAG